MDALRLVVAPTVTGSGRRLLDHPGGSVGLRLVRHEATANGLPLLEYESAGAARTAAYEGVTAFVQPGLDRVAPQRRSFRGRLTDPCGRAP